MLAPVVEIFPQLVVMLGVLSRRDRNEIAGLIVVRIVVAMVDMPPIGDRIVRGDIDVAVEKGARFRCGHEIDPAVPIWMVR